MIVLVFPAVNNQCLLHPVQEVGLFCSCVEEVVAVIALITYATECRRKLSVTQPDLYPRSMSHGPGRCSPHTPSRGGESIRTGADISGAWGGGVGGGCLGADQPSRSLRSAQGASSCHHVSKKAPNRDTFFYNNLSQKNSSTEGNKTWHPDVLQKRHGLRDATWLADVDACWLKTKPATRTLASLRSTAEPPAVEVCDMVLEEGEGESGETYVDRRRKVLLRKVSVGSWRIYRGCPGFQSLYPAREPSRKEAANSQRPESCRECDDRL